MYISLQWFSYQSIECSGRKKTFSKRVQVNGAGTEFAYKYHSSSEKESIMSSSHKAIVAFEMAKSTCIPRVTEKDTSSMLCVKCS